EMNAGANIVFQVAGGCGLGALDAAKQKHVWGIGVDADQAYIGPQILTSAVKRVDVDVYTTIAQLRNGIFKPARTFGFKVLNGGIDIGKISPKVPKKYVRAVLAIKNKIKHNKIHIPNTVP